MAERNPALRTSRLRQAFAMIRFLANALWILLSLPEALRWQQATHNVAAVQREVLLRILRQNRIARYVSGLTPAALPSVETFQHTFPLTTYEDYAPWIDQISAGEETVLTTDPVLLLEPTSGSTAATKLIPYTETLKAEFQRGIAPWVVRTFLRQPALFSGQAYWSVTPVTARNRRSAGGVAIGFEEEGEYFGGMASRLINAVMAVPPAVKLIADMASFRYVTLLFLLRSRSLSLISVWNPTFLTLLLEPLPQEWSRLAADIAAGTLTPPTTLDADLHRLLAAQLRPNRRRAGEIRQIMTTETRPARQYLRLWPRLRLISCWADGNAGRYAEEVGRLFPQARLQPKGLLATEGFVSFPYDGQPGAALSLRSHFFEFIADAGDRPLLAHELALGEQYSVVITTGGGLYRYQLGDVVEVTGFYNECPLIRLIGRNNAISDWYGEKLNESHVRQALDTLLSAHGLTPAFAMLACDDSLARPAYVLYVQDARAADGTWLALAAELETKLAENIHYAYCRQLGQLGAVGVFRIHGDALAAYVAACVAQGQRAGNIKPVALHRRGGWSQIFDGSLLPPSSPPP